MKKEILSTTAAIGLAVALFPAAAFASDANTNVMLEADDAQISFTAPTTIAYAVNADGTFTTPTAATTLIENHSVFPIHVSSMGVAVSSGFNLETQAAYASNASSDVLWSSVKPNAGTAVQFASFTTATQPTAGEWNMAKQGAAGANISLSTAGAIKNITKDISSSTKAFQVTWTVSAGSAS